MHSHVLNSGLEAREREIMARVNRRSHPITEGMTLEELRKYVHSVDNLPGDTKVLFRVLEDDYYARISMPTLCRWRDKRTGGYMSTRTKNECVFELGRLSKLSRPHIEISVA